MELIGRHRVHDAVRPDGPGILGDDADARLHARPHAHGAGLRIAHQRPHEGMHHVRHHAGHDGALQVGGLYPPVQQYLGDQDTVLVGSPGHLGHDAEGGKQRLLLVHAQRHIRIAYIYH